MTNKFIAIVLVVAFGMLGACLTLLFALVHLFKAAH